MNDPFLDVLRQGSRFVLSGHERPDGDCVGAQVALQGLLRALGKQAVICNPDPAPDFAEVLGEEAAIEAFDPETGLPECDVLVLLDCAHLSRLGKRLADAVQSRRPTVAVIDHHVGSEAGDGDVAYVDVDAPATGALVLRLFRHFEVPVPRLAAEAVFLSLVSDTGWFRYSNTTAEVFEIARQLVEAGVEPSRVYDALHRRNHPDSVDFLTHVLSGWRSEHRGTFAYVLVDRDSIERATRIGFDLDGIMEPIRSIRGIEVVAMLKDAGKGGVKVSLRAVGAVDVQAIAAGFGGGGHKKAAGATLDGTLDEALAALRPEVVAAIDEVGVTR